MIIDLVSTLLFDSEEKLGWSAMALENGNYADSIYHSYNVFVNSAKAMLLGENVKNSSQMSVIQDFDRIFVEPGTFKFAEGSFKEHVLQINKHEPDQDFANTFYQRAKGFLNQIKEVRESQTEKAV